MPGYSSSHGITAKIRKEINFMDELKWREFSSRRLELINKFQLSEYKASEQDQNIKHIANVLRTEFRFPLSAQSQFEKLVTAAVQSVRRNRRRSSRRHSATAAGGGGGGGGGVLTPAARKPSLPGPLKQETLQGLLVTPLPSDTNIATPMTKVLPPPAAISLHTTNNSSISPRSALYHHAPPQFPSHKIETQQQPPKNPETVQNTGTVNEHLIKTVILDIVNNVIPLAEQSKMDITSRGPNLLSFIQQETPQGSQPQTQPARTLNLDKPNSMGSGGGLIPFFLKEKLLLSVQRSKTCFDISKQTESVSQYNSNLINMGHSAILISIQFIMERFFPHIKFASAEYIMQQTTAPELLSTLSTNLFDPATRSNLAVQHTGTKLALLHVIIGAIIKDFGFDPTLYQLSEIFNHIIITKYPLPRTGGTPPPDTLPVDPRSTVLATLSMKPQAANSEVCRKVKIRFNSKEQDFMFPLLSNGPPTVVEIVENCKKLFGVVSDCGSPLGIFYMEQLIGDDLKLAKLFNDLSTECLILELQRI
ncbi:uncharacterized protein KNAG_0D01580 [Huiozyma naganishii CBS 8797]|uniref:Transcription factor VHR1 n=1 Tax=Huiozyma naganishii (strain ATCC MYA-139 / BCRC 22969 / CBS 8797 / KCTC 17520 / NBRC 10181 / NCYC 3082 / Yp74L-3) TaxID=1071383 RepID=J7R4Y7_HUIN7|nr:hypothetical protein KNAG_0D01580 [Kazachstania naganishii CBS 8797]CCK69910.1 hypothetical protein KNAG_0D01580 [Kazachstania naganishii CBS 8797]